MKKRYRGYRAIKSKKQFQPPPKGTHTIDIIELLTDGCGLGKAAGKAVMIAGALPNEVVEFEYVQQTKQVLTGQLKQVLAANPYRVEPRCQYYGQCGGCSLQHLAVEQQIAFKAQQLLSNLKKQANTQPKKIAEPLTAKYWGYRRRARLGIKQIKDENTIHIGFRGYQSSQIVHIDTCEVLAPALSALISVIADMVGQLSQPDSITQVEMALGESRPVLCFRHMLPLTTNDIDLLLAFADKFSVIIYLQSGDATTVKGISDNAAINYKIAIQTQSELAAKQQFPTLNMAFMPYHFTQVNAAMNDKMLTQAIEWLDIQSEDSVLDLFCGLGNFTLPIAQRAKQVVGIEGSKALVDWAKQNAESNGLDNVSFYQADLTQDTQMMAWRVKYEYNKLLIDPPRAGAIEILPLINALNPERICYVSCHPATLSRDIDVLVNRYGYKLKTAGVMDMFPHTAHVESMALLVKK